MGPGQVVNYWLRRWRWAPGLDRMARAAIRSFRQLPVRVNRSLRPFAATLLQHSYVKANKLASDPGPAGVALRCCSLFSYASWSDTPVDTVRALKSESAPLILKEAAFWAGKVCETIQGYWDLPVELLDRLQGELANDVGRLVFPTNLKDSDAILGSYESILAMRERLHEEPVGIPAFDLSETDARAVVESSVRILRAGGPLCKDLPRTILRFSSLPRNALDGFELDVLKLGIQHVPAVSSPRRIEVRDRLISVIDEWASSGTPWQRRPKGMTSLEFWRRNIDNAIAEYDEAERKGVPVASSIEAIDFEGILQILYRIGDDAVLNLYHRWRENPPISRWFDSESLLEAGCKLNRWDKRKKLYFGEDRIRLARRDGELLRRRRSPIEVFAYLDTACDSCGGELISLFDLDTSHPQLAFLHLPAPRVCIPWCRACSESEVMQTALILCSDDRQHSIRKLSRSGIPFRSLSADFNSDVRIPSPHAHLSFVGGPPRWEQSPQYPACDGCGLEMTFFGQIALGETGVGDAVIYSFVCPQCMMCATLEQGD